MELSFDNRPTALKIVSYDPEKSGMCQPRGQLALVVP
jgi:hypothetical protein